MTSSWLLALLLAAAPPGRVPMRETAEAGELRYQSIADDIGQATREPRTQALLAAIAVHESGLRLDVDLGLTRGDAGRAVGLWQLQGVSADLPRAEQARVALRRVQQSFKACASSLERFRLAAYTSGSCSKGWPESAAIIDSWQRLLAGHPAPRGGA